MVEREPIRTVEAHGWRLLGVLLGTFLFGMGVGAWVRDEVKECPAAVSRP